MIEKRYYSCAECHKKYEMITSDEDAHAEFEQHFPGQPIQNSAIVCDKCYYELMNANNHPIGEPRYIN